MGPARSLSMTPRPARLGGGTLVSTDSGGGTKGGGAVAQRGAKDGAREGAWGAQVSGALVALGGPVPLPPLPPASLHHLPVLQRPLVPHRRALPPLVPPPPPPPVVRPLGLRARRVLAVLPVFLPLPPPPLRPLTVPGHPPLLLLIPLLLPLATGPGAPAPRLLPHVVLLLHAAALELAVLVLAKLLLLLTAEPLPRGGHRLQPQPLVRLLRAALGRFQVDLQRLPLDPVPDLAEHLACVHHVLRLVVKVVGLLLHGLLLGVHHLLGHLHLLAHPRIPLHVVLDGPSWPAHLLVHAAPLFPPTRLGLCPGVRILLPLLPLPPALLPLHHTLLRHE